VLYNVLSKKEIHLNTYKK